jgi:septal ring factor EnvC (AmiA/AmiB activator)
VIAVQDGIVAYAGTANGNRTLSLDHAGGWSTQYSDLERLLVRPTDRFLRRRKERVQAGDIIGHAPRSLLRIRFALSRWTDDQSEVVDPGTWMPAWSVLPWFDGTSPLARACS